MIKTAKRAGLALLALILGVGFQLIAPTAAHAGTCTTKLNVTVCGEIFHANDAGYDEPIGIRCDYGDPSTAHSLVEGQRSTRYCKDTDEVLVRAGEELWCNYPRATQAGPVPMWSKIFDATGWHKITDIFNDGAGCNLRKDVP